MDYDFIVKETDKTLHKPRENGMFLSDEEISILSKYDINYLNYNSINELIFVIQDCLDNSYIELDDLDYLQSKLAEFNYYNNTNK